MRITTKLTIDMKTGDVLEHLWYEHSGPVAELKKGRGQLSSASNAGQQNTQQAQGIASQDQGIQNGYRNSGDQIVNSQTNTQGGLSPLVSKQLANEQGMIGKAYSTAATAANKGLAQRGMGAAPSGLTASINNSAINNAGQAQTGAVGNAFGTQNQLNQGSLGYDVGQQSQYNPLNALQVANQGVNATTGAASALNKAGSTLGDVGTGLGTIAGLAGSVKGLGGFSGIGNSVMNG